MIHKMIFAEDYLDFDPAEADAEVRSALPDPAELETEPEAKPLKIRLINLEHIVLHREAWQAIEQAEVAGWDEAFVIMSGGLYPRICFYKTGESKGLIADTVPGYMEQYIYGYADIKWNRPILTPAQVQSLKWLLDEAGSTRG